MPATSPCDPAGGSVLSTDPWVLLVTGTTGIAAAASDLARDRGWQVTAAGLPDYDLTSPAAATRAVEHCLDTHGRLDALFNVAGASGRRHGDGPLHDCSDEGWRFTFDANLTTTFHATRAALRYWLSARRPGVILSTTSVLAEDPEPARFATHAYAAAKGAIISLTKSIASYYAPHNIRANAIAPSLVRTPMSARAQADPGILDFLRSKHPLSKDMLPAEDVAQAALFLLSPESRYITGEILTIDAGWRLS